MSLWQANPSSAPLRGEVRVPSDKSITHRALLLGGLASGTTEIHHPLLGEDARSTLAAVQALGALTETSIDRILITGKEKLLNPTTPINCGNAGTLIRLLAGALCGRSVACVLDGDASLCKRPMGRIIKPLTAMGARITATAQATPPLSIEPTAQLQRIEYTLPQASAQVKSAVLLAGLCARQGAVVIEPQQCRNHTELMLPSFGAQLNIQGSRIEIAPGPLHSASVHVPADISSAAFYMVAATITPGSDILLRDVGINPTRTGVIDILRKMGAALEIHNKRMLDSEPIADIRVTSAKLHNIDLNTQNVPAAIDELPIVFVAASFANGMFRMRGATELRTKESDRLSTMSDALQALGIQVIEYDDGLDIIGGNPVSGGTTNSCGDHRIAMAMAVAALQATDPVQITDCEPVATSFPDFRQLAETVGWSIDETTAD